MVDNTHVRAMKEDVEIVVGDEKQSSFMPRMKIKRWDNEVNFSVGVISDHKGSHHMHGGEHDWDDGHGVKARFYEKPDEEFEFEVELASRPDSNVLHLSIESKGLEFFYQPELSEHEKEIVDINGVMVQRSNRSGRMIGSYAVYHSTKKDHVVGGNNYRNGRAFYIYRPYAVDSNGWNVWCDLCIDDEMRITIPQTFVDEAEYPIIIDPTFGCDPAGSGTSVYYASNKMICLIATSPTDVGTAQSISVKMGSMSGSLKGVITDSDGNIITNGIGDSTGYSAGWNTSEFGTDPVITASTSYLLSIIADSWVEIQYDYASSGRVDNTNSYASPQDTGDLDQGYSFLIYCTYTAAVAGTARSKIDGGLSITGLINGGLIS